MKTADYIESVRHADNEKMAKLIKVAGMSNRLRFTFILEKIMLRVNFYFTLMFPAIDFKRLIATASI